LDYTINVTNGAVKNCIFWFTCKKTWIYAEQSGENRTLGKRRKSRYYKARPDWTWVEFLNTGLAYGNTQCYAFCKYVASLCFLLDSYMYTYAGRMNAM